MGPAHELSAEKESEKGRTGNGEAAQDFEPASQAAHAAALDGVGHEVGLVQACHEVSCVEARAVFE